MRLVDPVIYVEDYDGVKIMKRIERACRVCYRSEGNITEDSYKSLLKNCISRGHESVLEHEKVSVRIRADIGTYKDLTRHRFASFSVESTRYCNYGKNKFDNEIKIIKPCHIEEGTELYDMWKEAIEDMEKHYLAMSKAGQKHSTAAEYSMTANIREWKHILSLRCSNHTHPSIRQVLIPLLLKFKEDMPEIFGDVPYDEDFPKEKYAEIKGFDEE